MKLTLLELKDIEKGYKLAKPTELALLQRVYANEQGYGEFWTKTYKAGQCFLVETEKYTLGRFIPNMVYPSGGIRPVLEFDRKSFAPFKDQKEVTFGEFPQRIASTEEQNSVAKKVTHLNKTGKTYTFRFNTGINYISTSFAPYPEYFIDNKKYILAASFSYGFEEIESWLSPSKIRSYLIEVKPITWIVDSENMRLISKKILVGGVTLVIDPSKTCNFKNTELYSYLQNYMLPEIKPSSIQNNSFLDQDPNLQTYFLGEKKKQLIKGKK